GRAEHAADERTEHAEREGQEPCRSLRAVQRADEEWCDQTKRDPDQEPGNELHFDLRQGLSRARRRYARGLLLASARAARSALSRRRAPGQPRPSARARAPLSGPPAAESARPAGTPRP